MPHPSWDVAAFSVFPQRLPGALQRLVQRLAGLQLPLVLIGGFLLSGFSVSPLSWFSWRLPLRGPRWQVSFRLLRRLSMASCFYFSSSSRELRI
ncbi:hypothetical protein NDU88_004957 [Pleurodeles waltl]|uniref:Uncharacterized protein n=1 Tax=Pleurodeles waltl TaxID=8319 RepID=A0AAV7QDD3_PLEWA|nr:hypothetical protein NDU88_004957 [Pleurodeles waltl]